MKKEISKQEYFELVGLLTLAHNLKNTVDLLQESMENIVGEGNDIGSMSGDMIWDEDGSIDKLLKNLNIKVNGSKKLHN